jgi:hypothetical protein
VGPPITFVFLRITFNFTINEATYKMFMAWNRTRIHGLPKIPDWKKTKQNLTD